MNTLKPLIFPVDTIAHMQRHEKNILPLTDELKRCYYSIHCTIGDANGHDKVLEITDYDGKAVLHALYNQTLRDVLWGV